jgi:signal transduction histidine kinase
MIARDGGGSGRERLWRWYLAVAAASGWGFFFPTVAATVGWGLVYVSGYLLCVAAVLVGVRRNRPARPLAWYLLAAGYFGVAVAVATWYPYVLWTGTAPSYPSIADGLFLCSYAILLAGLVVLIRRGNAGRDRAGLLDAAIMASGLGVLGWVYLIQPQLVASSLSLAGQAATIAYPLVDIMLVGILARMAFAPGVRRPAFWLLSAGLLAQLTADVLYTVTSLQGTFSIRSSAALPFYVLGYAFVGAAALHPSMTTLSDPAGRHEERGTRWRLLPLALAALTPSAVAILESGTGRTVNVPVISSISAVLFVLVLARVAGLMEDITRYHRVEKLRNEFVSLVSHELRTPLTSIRGALGLVASGRLGSIPDDGREMLDIAVRNTERLGRLLDDILDLERMDSGKLTLAKQPYSARGLAEQAAAAMRPMAEQASVRLRFAGPEAMVLADPYRVVQALTNLLGNAIKFSPPATTVWVTTQPRRGEVLFRVKDQGRGIPADQLEAIFGRFQQVDSSDARDKGGSGLGLAICRSIIQQHGGRIWVQSTPGEGSTFSFTLPLLAAAAAEQPNGRPTAISIKKLAD